MRDPNTLLTHLPATKEVLSEKMGIGTNQVSRLVNKYTKQKLMYSWGRALTTKGVLSDIYHRNQ